MPKWRFLPARCSALKSPAPSKVRRVLHEGPRSADPPSSHGTFSASTFNVLARCVAGREAFGIRDECRQSLVPAVRQLAPQHAIAVVGELWILALVPLEPGPPGVMERLPPRADARLEVFAYPLGDEELRVLGPAITALRELDFLFAQRLAVRRARILLVGRTVGDVAIDDHERGSIGRLFERLEGPLQHLEIVGVAHPCDVPAVADEAGGDVVAVGQRRVALDGDVVVVVDPAQVRELEVPGQRGGLAGDPFHQAAVAAQRVDVVVEQVEPRPVEVACQPALGDGHPDTRRHALAQWPGGRLDARRPAILRVPGTLAVQLPEALDVLERHRQLSEGFVLGVDGADSGQVEHGVEQHGGVAGGQDESVAIGPDRMAGIEAQEALPQAVDHRRQRHRRSRVPGVRLLYGVHGQCADGVHAKLVHRFGHRWSLTPRAFRGGRRTRSASPRAACRRNPPRRAS